MFIVAQLIGLYIIHVDPLTLEANVNGTIQSVPNPQLSFIQPPEGASPLSLFFNILLAFVIAIGLMFILMRYKVKFFLRLWFFLVVVFALWIVFYTIEIIVPFVINPLPAVIIPLIFAVPLAYIKIYRKNMIVHNLTELLVYPGIAVIFVSLLTQWSPIKNLILIIFLLILISIYDIIAVLKTRHMIKLAKFQAKSKIFAGLLVPYKKLPKEDIPKGNLTPTKGRIAVLGGGDIGFPLIFAGVVMKDLMLTNPEIIGFLKSLVIPFFTTIALLFLLIKGKKDKFYPAMPYLSIGCFVGFFVIWLFF